MRHLDAALLALLALAATAFGAHSLAVAVAIGDRPGLEAWSAPLVLALLGVGLLTAVAAAVRRTGAGGLLGAALAWALGVRGVVELPVAATNFDYLDGLHLAPWVLAVAGATGLYAAGARASATTRAAVLCTVAAASNGRVFARESEAVYALLGLSVLWLAVEVARGERRRVTGAGRLWIALGAAFVLWVLAAALLGGTVVQGLRVASRVAIGAVLALSLAAGLDGGGRRALLNTLAALAAASLVAAALALVQAASIEGWERVLATRFRLFGMHPNGVGPFLAGGAVVSFGAALAGRGPLRVGLVAVGLCSSALLVASESRASLLGGLAAIAALAASVGLRTPRRAWPSVALVAVPVLAVVAAWSGPWGPGLRDALDARALGPSAIGQRYHFWRMALEGLERSPWFGVGPNQYEALARYAEPSYYDGTTQTLHSHNVELAVAAGAGWPALVLLLGLFVALLELTRRALLRAEDRAARARAGALFGFAVAVLTANQLDLGQTQQTFVPLALWIALGWLGSTAATGSGAPLRLPRLAAWSAALVLLQPLLGIALQERAERRLEAGDPSAAIADWRLATRLDPANLLALTRAATVARNIGRPAVELELRQELVDRAPERAGAWLALARAFLERGRLDEAARAVHLADELDPRGERRSTAAILRAGVALGRGDLELARASLLRSVREQGAPWTQLETVVLATDATEGAGRPLGFPHAAGVLPLAELLDTVGAEAVEHARTDPVAARRELRSVVDGFLAEGRPERALEWLDRHRAARGTDRLPSLDTLDIEARLAADDPQGALELVRGLRTVAHATVQTEAARAALAIGEPGLAAEAIEAGRALAARTDLFFEAGLYRGLSELELELARVRGRWPEVRRNLDRAWRERRAPADRRLLAEQHWRALEELEPDLPTVLHALAHLLAARSAERRGVPAAARRREFQDLAASALALVDDRGAFLARARGALGATGWAGREFLDALPAAP